jgi:hypothetical protein
LFKKTKMSKTNTFETDILELIFNNTAIANIGDSSGLQPSSTAGSLYVALFTADPTETGSQTNEATYTGYARVAVARTSGGWTISGNNCSNTAAITFGECTAGSETITHVGILTASTAGDMLFSGVLTSSLAVSTGIIPEFAIGTLDINED